MDVVFEDDALRITFEPGSPDQDAVILAFTGCRHELGRIARDDFVRTSRSTRIVRDVYFVNDLGRCWYNGLHSTIVGILAPRVAGRRVVTLGNSMGGFGALLFSGLFETCDTAVAFVPQYSVDRRIVPFEDRWREHVAQIPAFDVATCFHDRGKYGARRKYVFYGDQSRNDARQAELLLRAADVDTHVFTIRDGTHEVAAMLKERNVLAVLLDTATDATCGPGDISALLSRHDIAHSWTRPERGR